MMETKARAARLLLFALFFTMLSCCLPRQALADTLTTYGGMFAQENTGFQAFLREHPDTQVVWGNGVYDDTSQFTAALVTGELRCDLYTLQTQSYAWPILMQKGYCLDLSGSQVLSGAVARMHPNIASRLHYEGRLYAVPWGLTFTYLQVAGDVWQKAGLTAQEVPQSFPQFLDFLDSWCQRIEAAPQPSIRTYGDADTTEALYLSWLASLLINEAAMQMQYANQPLRFDDPALLSLLQRAEAIAKRLYPLEAHSGPYHLFENTPAHEWPRHQEHLVYLRVHEGQPRLIKAALNLWGVHPQTKRPEACIELLERTLTGEDPLRHPELFLYRDAQPLVNPQYEEDSQRLGREIAGLKQDLEAESLSLDSRDSLTQRLSALEYSLQQVENQQWVMSPAQMADYQSAADRLYFPGPNIFVGSLASENLESLIKRFGARQLPAQQFLQELDRIAVMMEREAE